MKKYLVVFAVLSLVGGLHLLSGRNNADAATAIVAGDLIRGTTFNAIYYYGKDGFRYVFPNEKTYFTWYTDFAGVKTISDAQLGEIQIGGNVTYRPGQRMIKINTDPRTYAVAANGILRHVPSEAIAKSLYGATWNKQIDDVPDGFFTNYAVGDAIVNATDYNRDAITGQADSINNDKELQAPILVTMSDSAITPNTINGNRNRVVKFTNTGTTNHAVSSDDLSWGSGTMMPGKSFSKKFTKVGTYSFFDSYNSQLSGAVNIQ